MASEMASAWATTLNRCSICWVRPVHVARASSTVRAQRSDANELTVRFPDDRVKRSAENEFLPCLDESLEVTGLLPAVMCGIIDQRTREGKLSENSNRMLMAGLGEGLGEDE